VNTAGYRFKSAVPLSYNTYISRLDYQLDSAGKHMLFWRGNLQNDHLCPRAAFRSFQVNLIHQYVLKTTKESHLAIRGSCRRAS